MIFFSRLCFISLLVTISPLPVTAQWFQQPSGTNRHLFAIDMVDADTGYVVGGVSFEPPIILKTTDGGITWISQAAPASLRILRGVSFQDSDIGVAVALFEDIIRTTDGGATWNWVFAGNANRDLLAVQYVNQELVYTVGNALLKSMNGGLNWTHITTFPILCFDLHFSSPDSGILVGQDGWILTTTDGGSSWVQRYLHLPPSFVGDSSLYAIDFVDDTIGYVAGNNGIVAKTTDRGVNWQLQPTSTLTAFSGISFPEVNVGTVVGNAGGIFRTTDGGEGWIQQAAPFITPLTDISFLNPDTGWIVGFNGVIFKTTNGGGITAIDAVDYQIPDSYILEQNYPNPFNAGTIITFSLPKSGFARLQVYNLSGKKVAILVSEHLSAGTYHYRWNAPHLPGGVYFFRLTVGGYSSVKKALLIK